MYGIGTVGTTLGGGLYLTLPAELLVAKRYIFIRADPNGIGKTGLADLAVAPSLFGDGVKTILRQSQMLRPNQVCQAFGEIKIVNSVVTHGQIQHRIKGDGLNDAGGNIQNQKLDFQLVPDKSKACQNSASSRDEMGQEAGHASSWKSRRTLSGRGAK